MLGMRWMFQFWWCMYWVAAGQDLMMGLQDLQDLREAAIGVIGLCLSLHSFLLRYLQRSIAWPAMAWPPAHHHCLLPIGRY